jgi:predicted PurR-regulated permease PerM
MMDGLELSAARKRSASSPAMIGLFFLALIASLYLAAELLVPVAFAILLNLLFSPAVRWLSRRRVPVVLGAGVLVVAMIAIIVFALATLAGPANAWLDDAPRTVRELQQQMTAAKGNLANIQELADEVEQLSAEDSPQRVQTVEVKGPGVIESVVGGLPTVAAFAGVVIFLTFFLLASGDSLLRRMTSCGRTWSERRRIVMIARQIESDLSRYLATVTVINAGLGIAVAVTMYFLEVPNPLLWGVMAYLLNFAPYVGALTSAAVLTLVGLMTFDTLGEALMVPGAFLCLTILEGQLLTPSILGNRMSLSPIVIFVAVIFWGWLWGIGGALMAVPLMTCIKVVCDQVPGLRLASNFLSRDPAGPAANPTPRPLQQSFPLDGPSAPATQRGIEGRISPMARGSSSNSR